MPHQSVLRLSVGFEVVDFGRDPMMTFGLVTLHSLLWVAWFGKVDIAFFDHSIVGVFPYFHARKSSLRYPWLMIGSWRVLASLVVLIDDTNVVGVKELGSSSFAEVKLTSSPLRASWRVCLAALESDGLLSYTKWCTDGWSRHAPQSLSQTRATLTILWERVSICVCAYLVRAFWRVYIELMTLSL